LPPDGGFTPYVGLCTWFWPDGRVGSVSVSTSHEPDVSASRSSASRLLSTTK
jgi:hypothetical protein